MLVIGASGRIGKEVCKEILAEGATVFAADREMCPEIRTLIDCQMKQGNTLKFLEVDVTDEDQVVNLFGTLPVVNGVVNCSIQWARIMARIF